MIELVDLVVLAVVALAVYVVVRAALGSGRSRALPGPGQWRATHYDARGATWVVVQTLSPGGTNILDEHLVATIRLDDPDYDSAFLAAMATARERRAIFETEEDS